jgi:DNA helicase HerA-like ATPase
MSGERLGVIVRGSLSRGLEMRIDPGVPLEELRAGMFAVTRGGARRYLALITDLQLAAASSNILDAPVPPEGSLLRAVLEGDAVYSQASLRPHLVLEEGAAETLQPVRGIPPHFTEVCRASREDVEAVFGREGESAGVFRIGAPLDMDDIAVCLDLQRFVQRSNGIFGKSGTGKTFLTRLVLAGLIHSGLAVNLVFDMHNEYGQRGTDERSETGTWGLQRLFGRHRVEVFTLDPQRAADADYQIRIPYTFLDVEDVLGLQNVLQLSPTAAETVHLLAQRNPKGWFGELVAGKDSDDLVAGETGAHAAAVAALRRKLVRLSRECGAFLRPDAEFAGTREPDSVERIVNNLRGGKHTIVQFGRYDQLLHYLLVSNLITRRIDERWRELAGESIAGRPGAEPPPRVVITIEEAHRFLEPGIAQHTSFGRIARELRKYQVTLLIVDQRPSRIESEVLSQLGTKICCLLDDEHDVQAVLAGTASGAGLRGVLAGLDTRQQALIFGDALPMPVAVRTREYGTELWRELGGGRDDASLAEEARRNLSRDFPPDD